MNKFILGRKIGMTQVFDEKGRVTPVTLIEAEPCAVTQIRTKEKDGYSAVQIGFERKNKLSKPQVGHLKSVGNFSVLREFSASGDYKPGDTIDVSVFQEGDKVKVSGISKAKGFQGVVKKHGFAGGPASHGQKHSQREPGSIGSVWPQRVLKGQRMASRMGGVRRTVSGLKVAKVEKDENLIAVTGAIPGRRGTLVEIVACK